MPNRDGFVPDPRPTRVDTVRRAKRRTETIRPRAAGACRPVDAGDEDGFFIASRRKGSPSSPVRITSMKVVTP